VNQAGTTARLGKGEFFVVEADESDPQLLAARTGRRRRHTIDRGAS